MIKKYYTQERLALPQMRILVFSSPPPPARASRSDGASFFRAARMKRQKVFAEF